MRRSPFARGCPGRLAQTPERARRGAHTRLSPRRDCRSGPYLPPRREAPFPPLTGTLPAPRAARGSALGQREDSAPRPSGVCTMLLRLRRHCEEHPWTSTSAQSFAFLRESRSETCGRNHLSLLRLSVPVARVLSEKRLPVSRPRCLGIASPLTGEGRRSSRRGDAARRTRLTRAPRD